MLIKISLSKIGGGFVLTLAFWISNFGYLEPYTKSENPTDHPSVGGAELLKSPENGLNGRGVRKNNIHGRARIKMILYFCQVFVEVVLGCVSTNTHFYPIQPPKINQYYFI